MDRLDKLLIISTIVCGLVLVWGISGEFYREEITVSGIIKDVRYVTEYSYDGTHLIFEDGTNYLIRGLKTNFIIGDKVILELEHATRDNFWNLVEIIEM